MPTVVNRHHFKKKPLPAPARYIGRGSPLGNPFTVKEHGRDAAWRKYREHLYALIQRRDPKVMRELRAIREETTLVCSCKPAPCHGDIVVAAWQWARREGILDEGRMDRPPAAPAAAASEERAAEREPGTEG